MDNELPKLIESLKKQVKLVTVLDYFEIEYEESDERFRIVCPFHDDQVPSLIIYNNNEDGYDTFWCPPCPRTGDSFEFIRLMIRLRTGLSLEDKSDFQQSLELLKRLANYIETKLDIKESIINKLTKEEVKEKETRDGHKKYYYMCGIEIRDALKSGFITEKEADEVFAKIDIQVNNKDIKVAETFYDKVRAKIKRRRNNVHL